MNQPIDKVISLDDFRKQRKEQEKKFTPALTFEVGQYYIMPELGVMIHCVNLTDKFHRNDGHPTYIMEDQYGNVFAEKMEEGVTKGWHALSPDVFVSTAEKLRRDTDPPEPIAG